MKIIFITTLLLIYNGSYSQIKYGDTNNTKYHQFLRNGNGTAVYINQISSEPNRAILRLSSGTDIPNESVKFTVENNGYVGIGINSPTDKLHIKGNFSISNSQQNANEYFGELKFFNSYATQNFHAASIGVKTKISGNGAWDHSNIVFSTWNGYNSLSEKMRISANGDVGIGTDIPDAKLTVKGDIHSQEVKVDLNGAVAPDFVFENDYNLRSLTEVEEYINIYKHLPGIPPGREMEEKGLMLKEMNLKLLQKIEELTLYLIEQNKKIKKLEKKVEQLENDK